MKKPPLSWNRNPYCIPGNIKKIYNRHQELPTTNNSILAYGSGRSYGDVCLNEGGTLLMTRGLNRFIAFDSTAGVLRCEAGVTLAEILALVVPQGWFLPSTPGTRYATLGGAIVNDTHGKNHHVAGTIGHHVKAFELLRSDSQRLVCRPDSNRQMFQATLGGLGLTGLLTWVEIALLPIKTPYMWVESYRFRNLDEYWKLNSRMENRWPYTVAWVDCLAKGKARGRGIYYAARHAECYQEQPISYKYSSRRVPFDPPFSLVNSLSLKAFNSAYYHRPIKPQGYRDHYIRYFYPLDAIQGWNRIYGKKGFFQYQCVLPRHTERDGIEALLKKISASGHGSFLAVLKTFSDRPSLGMLSFARPGTTLALDFPNRGIETLNLFKELDNVVREAGGTLYPAKDARMPPELFKQGFPQWQSYAKYIDPAFSSSFWRRVTL